MQPGSKNTDVVHVELERGSKIDPVMLLLGVSTMILGFLTMYDTDIWSAREDLWAPIAGAGAALVILNLLVRIVRPKLAVDLLTDKGDRIMLRMPKNLQFSGWVNDQQIEVGKSEIKTAKVFDFKTHTSTGTAGMYWISFELKSGRILQSHLEDGAVIRQVIEFIRARMPQVDLIVGDRIKL